MRLHFCERLYFLFEMRIFMDQLLSVHNGLNGSVVDLLLRWWMQRPLQFGANSIYGKCVTLSPPHPSSCSRGLLHRRCCSGVFALRGNKASCARHHGLQRQKAGLWRWALLQPSSAGKPFARLVRCWCGAAPFCVERRAFSKRRSTLLLMTHFGS